MPWKPSTIRAELARLEELGLLQHPHTSAGRVPTDQGYRHYVDELLEGGALPVPRKGVQLGDMRREIDEAMRATTEQLSQMTDLLAVVSAPPIATTTIRHVEVLLLQPQVAMVVVITSTGGVTKRVISYDEPVDPGLVDWAGSYLSETLDGMKIGARMIHARLDRPVAGRRRARVPRHARAGLHRARGDRGGLALLRRRGAPAAGGALPGALADQRADAAARAPQGAARARPARARRAERVALDRRGERAARAAVGQRRGVRATGSRTGASARSASWGRCGWTTRRRSRRSARPPRSCRASSRTSTRNEGATPTRSSASRARPPTPRSRRPSASSRASCTRT